MISLGLLVVASKFDSSLNCSIASGSLAAARDFRLGITTPIHVASNYFHKITWIQNDITIDFTLPLSRLGFKDKRPPGLYSRSQVALKTTMQQ